MFRIQRPLGVFFLCVAQAACPQALKKNQDPVLTLRTRNGMGVPLDSPGPRPLEENRALGLLLWQAVTTLGIALLGLAFGVSVALSALLGGAISTLTNALFSYWVFRDYRAQAPAALVLRIYGAEGLKLALSLVLFVMVFLSVMPLSPPALFGAYLVVQVLPTLLAPATGAIR
jgi:ATP synthase protein I